MSTLETGFLARLMRRAIGHEGLVHLLQGPLRRERLPTPCCRGADEEPAGIVSSTKSGSPSLSSEATEDEEKAHVLADEAVNVGREVTEWRADFRGRDNWESPLGDHRVVELWLSA